MNNAVMSLLMPDLIPEMELLEQLEKFSGWGYNRHDPKYPEFYGGRKAVLAPPGEISSTNCCAFVEGLIGPVADRNISWFKWGSDFHKSMMIYDPDKPFSPTEGLISNGLARDGVIPRSGVRIPSWSVVQGWRDLDRGVISSKSRGHTFIILSHDPKSDKVLILESNSGYSGNGVGYRSVGLLNDCRSDVSDLLSRSDWTAEKILNNYDDYRICCLNVDSEVT